MYRTDKDADWPHGTSRFPPQTDLGCTVPPQQDHTHRHSPRVSLRQQVPRGGGYCSATDNESPRSTRHRRNAAGQVGMHGGSGTSVCSSGL